MVFNSRKLKKFLAGMLGFGAMATLLSSCEFGGLGGSDGVSVDLTQPVKVALLVPKGASNATIASIGKSLENSAQLAMRERNSNEVELMVYSTAFSETKAIQQALKAKAEGAALIVGPLSGFNAALVAEAVQDIPVLTFSNNSEVKSENTYILGTTFELVANRVMGHVRSTGARTVGIISTNDASGEAGVQASVSAASKQRLSVVYSARYPLTREGINGSAPGIAAALKASEADALMISDTPQGGLGLMANALATQGYSSSDASFMGTARWDELPGFFSQTDLNGGFFAVPDPAAVSAFEGRYRAAFGSQPIAIGGLGYDGIALAIELVKDARRTRDNTPFSANDIRGKSINGAFGKFEFDRDNLADRDLAVRQVQGNTSVVVSAAQ